MMKKSFCSEDQDWDSRKVRYQKRKLAFLTFLRDSYERKLAAVTASIKTLQSQIESQESESSGV